MLGVGGVDLFCGRVHLQTGETRGTKGNKGNQGKPREPRETREPREPRETGETKGNPRETQGKPLQSTKEIPSNQWEYLQSIGFLSKQG